MWPFTNNGDAPIHDITHISKCFSGGMHFLAIFWLSDTVFTVKVGSSLWLKTNFVFYAPKRVWKPGVGAFQPHQCARGEICHIFSENLRFLKIEISACAVSAAPPVLSQQNIGRMRRFCKPPPPRGSQLAAVGLYPLRALKSSIWAIVMALFRNH